MHFPEGFAYKRLQEIFHLSRVNILNRHKSKLGVVTIHVNEFYPPEHVLNISVKTS
jgi:hypothetical protein